MLLSENTLRFGDIGVQVRLMRTEEITLGLKACSPLHFLPLDAHGLPLVLELHPLQLFLSTQVQFLLTPEHILVKLVLECESGKVRLLTGKECFLFKVRCYGFEFTVSPAVFVHNYPRNVQGADIDSEKLFNLWTYEPLHKFADLQNLPFNLKNRDIVVSRGIGHNAFDILDKLAFQLTGKDFIVYILCLVDAVEAADVIDRIYLRTMYRDRHGKILEPGVEYVEIWDRKVDLTALGEIGKIRLLAVKGIRLRSFCNFLLLRYRFFFQFLLALRNFFLCM